jgi:hypothetical protein
VLSTSTENSLGSSDCRIYAEISFLSPTVPLGQIISAIQDFSRGHEQHDDMDAALFHYFG